MGRQWGSPPRPRFAPGRGGLGGGRLAPAWAADVVSSNIVGYNKVTLTPATANSVGYTIVGVSFQEVGGDSLDINDILGEEFKQNLVGGYGTTDSDTIQVWNGTGYTFYYFSADDWSEEAGDGAVDAHQNSKWLTLGDEVANVSFQPGDAVWFCRAKGAGAINGVMSGEVPTEERTVSIPAGTYAMISSATPQALNLNDCGIDWAAEGVMGGYGTTDADTIQLWNGTGYTFYYFSADDWSEEAGDGTVDAYKNSKWLTLSDEPVATPINLCAGFWFKRNGSTDLTLTLP